MPGHSLLIEALFLSGLPGGEAARLTLPEVLARLSAQDDLVFLRLRPHQRAPWHAFLVQLAYLALEDREHPIPPLVAEEWAERLRGLTGNDDAPWCLINEDWQRPAFLQPPCSPGREADFKRSADAAQDIDVLVTARHHDEKSGKLVLDEEGLDALVYALITLQGWSAFLGAGNYNTMRMNGGFSSRPQFRLAYARGSGTEFRRDLDVLLETRDDLFEKMHKHDIGTSIKRSHSLLWLMPWDEGSLPLSAVHPLCLEVCRRVRLVEDEAGLRLFRASSNAMRVAAKEARGVVLDPWVPIVKDDSPKALTAQAHSFGYRSLQKLLFDPVKTTLPTLAKPSPDERRRRAAEKATLIAQVLVSGDGGTDGLLMRELPLPPAVLSRYADADAALGARSQKFVELAAQASGKAYRPALLQFVDGGDDVDWKNRDFSKAVEPWVMRFDSVIDEAFFAQLFGTFETSLDDTAAQRQWTHWLADTAREQLGRAVETLPTRDGSRLFARARAERLLKQSLHKQFASLLNAPDTAETAPDIREALHE